MLMIAPPHERRLKSSSWLWLFGMFCFHDMHVAGVSLRPQPNTRPKTRPKSRPKTHPKTHTLLPQSLVTVPMVFPITTPRSWHGDQASRRWLGMYLDVRPPMYGHGNPPITLPLYSTVLYCPNSHFTVLYCTVLYSTALYCPNSHCTVIHCTVLHYSVIQYTLLSCP